MKGKRQKKWADLDKVTLWRSVVKLLFMTLPTLLVHNRPQRVAIELVLCSSLRSNRLVTDSLIAMAERHRTCVLCQVKTSTLHLLPKTEELRETWLQFIFGEIPKNDGTRLVLCSAHFKDDDFVNFGVYSSGFASKLVLKPGVVRSRRLPTSPTAVSNFIYTMKSYLKNYL